MKIRTRYVFLLVLALVAVMVWSALSESGIADLDTEFTEIDAFQNENNTGPVKRSYVVVVSDSIWEDLKVYGNYMPYSKLGTTTVWFYPDGVRTPPKLEAGTGELTLFGGMSCLARYEKNSMGIVTLTKYPFTDRERVID